MVTASPVASVSAAATLLAAGSGTLASATSYAVQKIPPAQNRADQRLRKIFDENMRARHATRTVNAAARGSRLTPGLPPPLARHSIAPTTKGGATMTRTMSAIGLLLAAGC